MLGISSGAAIRVAYAARYPERVSILRVFSVSCRRLSTDNGRRPGGNLQIRLL